MSRREALDQRRKKDFRKWMATGGATAVFLGGGVLAVLSFQGDQNPESEDVSTEIPAECSTSQHINVVATGKIADIVKKIPVNAEDCISLNVSESASDKTASDIISGINVPHIWIPDSSTRANLYLDNKAKVTTVSDSLANTPGVIVSRDSKDFQTWSDVLKDSETIGMSDPKTESAAFSSLVSVAAEVNEDKVSRDQLTTGSAIRAQTIGVTGPVLSPTDLLDKVVDGEHESAIVTEADFVKYKDEHQDASLNVAVPNSGTTELDYPLLVPEENASNDTVSVAAQKISDYLGSDAGRSALESEGLRTSSGEKLSDVSPLDQPLELSQGDSKMLSDLWKSYVTQAAPLNGLVAIDSSSSMSQQVEGTDQSRMQITADAALAGSQLFPSRDSLGIWAFARDIGKDATGQTVDYKELVPIRGVDEDVDGRSQRDLVQEAITELAVYPNSQSGLYDTMLAGFHTVKQNYKPGATNVVIIMTDGVNDDENSIDKQELISTIQQEQDPNNPVMFLLIGVSDDAEMSTLHEIAPQIGGEVFEAETSADIQRVFQDAFGEGPHKQSAQ